jgi:hypothetical protein
MIEEVTTQDLVLYWIQERYKTLKFRLEIRIHPDVLKG